ncbi:MAG: triose-phosphate isomerase [Nevskiales bacterium]|nr:triose-phosphate isomerase [Nevskiales bacterium]
MSRRPLVAGNWKMNGSRDSNANLIHDVIFEVRKYPDVDVLVCPPAVYLDAVGRQLEGSAVQLGAQDLSEQPKTGAYTGEIHGVMLRDVGCTHVIVGHSERRSLYGEGNDKVAQKFATAQECGLIPILCVGETLEQRENGQTESVLAEQLGTVVTACGAQAFKQAVIAYEPVWAIGTGLTATPQQAQDAHAFLRAQLAASDAKIAGLVRILYGGSVKGENAESLFAGPDVDGGLIGGASLKAGEFMSICAAAAAQARSK